MNKSKFLKKLEKKLEILNDEELKDIIDEYESIIDEKVKHGKTEEEAINDFGDVSVLAKEILEAYKLNSSKVDEDDFFNSLDSTIKKGAKKISDYAKEVADEAEKEDITSDMIFEIVIKAIIVLILLMIPFSILRALIASFAYMALPSNVFGNFVVGVIGFVISIVFLALLIFVIYLIIKDTTNSGSVEKAIRKKVSNEVEKEVEKELEKEIKEEIRERNQIKAENDNSFKSILLTVLKVVLILHAIPIIFSLFSLYIFLGFAIYLLIKGVSAWGLIMISVAAIMASTFVLGLIFKLVKTNFRPKKIAISPLVTACVIFTIGIFFTIDFIGNIEFVNKAPFETHSTNVSTQSFVIDDNLESILMTNPRNYQIIVDQTVPFNQALVRVTYVDDFLEVRSIDVMFDRVVVSTTEKGRVFGLFGRTIEDLKENKVYNYSKIFDYEIEILVNQETLDFLESN